MSNGEKIEKPKYALLRELQQLHEAGSPLSPDALAELLQLVDAAIGPGPWDELGLLHGMWRDLRLFLESAT